MDVEVVGGGRGSKEAVEMGEESAVVRDEAGITGYEVDYVGAGGPGIGGGYGGGEVDVGCQIGRAHFRFAVPRTFPNSQRGLL